MGDASEVKTFGKKSGEKKKARRVEEPPDPLEAKK